MPALPELLADPAMIVTLAVAVVAGMVRGFAGFGAALVFMPVAAASLGPAVASPSLLLFDAVLALPLTLGALRSARLATVLPMAAGAVAFVPLGAYALVHADAAALRWGVCAIVFVALALLASGLRWPGPPRPGPSLGVGAAAGFMGGLAQISGPPVVVYLLGGSRPAAETRANLFVFFGCNTVVTLVAYAVAGLFTARVVATALVVGPAYALGLFTGSRLFARASEAFYRRLAFALILAAGVAGLPVWGW